MKYLPHLVLLLTCTCYSVTPFSQTEIDEAVIHLNDYKGKGGMGEYHALYFLAVATEYDPDATASNGVKVSTAFINTLNSVTKPSYGRTFAPAWANNCMAHSILLAKKNASIWNTLSQTDRERLDWMMKMLVVCANYHQNAANNPERSLDQTLGFRKTMNPNIQQAPLGTIIAGIEYFGSISNLNAVFTSFSYDAYLAADTQHNLGFDNKLTAKSNVTRAYIKNLMENGGTDQGGGIVAGVKIAFRYNDPVTGALITPSGNDASFDLFEVVADRMYNRRVVNQWNTTNGEGYTLSGSSPVLGEMGQLYELGSTGRCSASYAYFGWFNDIVTRQSLDLLGKWNSGGDYDRIARLMWVGSEDLTYKISQTHITAPYAETVNEASLADEGYFFLKEIWKNSLKEPVSSINLTIQEVNTLECENLSYTYSSGDVVNISSSDTEMQGGVLKNGVSDGAFAKFKPDSVNDFIEFTVLVPSTGTYLISAVGKTAANSARMKLMVGGNQVGDEWELNSNNTGATRHVDFGETTLNAGNRQLRFVVTNKPSGVTRATTRIDQIRLYKIDPNSGSQNSVIVEAEQTNYTASGAGTNVKPNSGATNGTYLRFNGNNIGDKITVPVTVDSGTYALRIRVLTNNSAGIYQLRLNGANSWSDFDTYASGTNPTVLDFGPVTISQSGTQNLEFRAVGKNNNSNNYKILLDTITFE